MIKKVSSTVVVLCLSVVLLGSTVFAKQGQVETLDQLKSKYNLEVVTDVPKGIIPIKFNSIEEADKYFAKTVSSNASNTITPSSDVSSTPNTLNQSGSVSPASITVKTVSKSAGYLNSSVYLNITCVYASNGSVIPAIYSVSSAIAGNTTNWGWAQTGYNADTILDGGRTRVLRVYGTLTQYVYVNGTTVRYTSSKSGSIEIYK